MKLGYTPTVYSSVFNIFGRESAKTTKTGLGYRPLGNIQKQGSMKILGKASGKIKQAMSYNRPIMIPKQKKVRGWL